MATETLTAPPAPAPPSTRDLLHESIALTEAERIAEYERSNAGRVAGLLIAGGADQALRYVDGQMKALQALRLASLQLTTERDWVLFRDKDENEWGLLRYCPRVSQLWQIEVFDVRFARADGSYVSAADAVPEPVMVQRDGGRAVRSWRYLFSARSKITGDMIRDIEAERCEDEQFVGRYGGAIDKDKQNESDPRKAARTLCESKAQRMLSGLVRVPPAEIEAAWQGSGKSLARLTRGAGYGSSKDRQATKVASDDAKKSRAELGREILARVGGDKKAAGALLKECTSNPEKNFAGFDSVERLTQDWQIDAAWKRLRAHPNHGDVDAGAAQADPKAKDRQPGEEDF